MREIIISAGCSLIAFLQTYDGAVTAAATVAIAVFTIVLACVTGRQVKLSRAEFISTHRPRLIARQFILDKPITNQALKIRFSIINIGDTDATWRHIAAESALWNGRDWEAPGIDPIVKPISQPPIKNGQRISVIIESKFNITAAQIRAVEQNELIICAVGELTYADALGTNRRTGFRRNYDPSTNMFAASKNEDQEYQD